MSDRGVLLSQTRLQPFLCLTPRKGSARSNPCCHNMVDSGRVDMPMGVKRGWPRDGSSLDDRCLPAT